MQHSEKPHSSPTVDAANGDTLLADQRPPAPREHQAPSRATGAGLLVLVILFGACLAAGFFVVNRKHAEQEADLAKEAEATTNAPPPVDVVPVKYAPASHDIQLPGECRAWYESTIYARVNGYLKNWNSDMGDRVKSGQVLATIETPELDQQLAASEAKVKADEAQINLAKANMHFSDVTLARFKDAPKGVVSDLERDEKAADYQTSEAKLGAAQSDLVSAQAQVDQIRAMIGFQKVVAPFDGVITERRVDVGDLITAGSTASTTSLFRIAQANKIRVFVDVPESVSSEIHNGDEAMVSVDELPGRTFKGSVARNSNAISNASKTLRVEVDVPNEEMVLLPGMYAKVSFKINNSHPELEIPASALTLRASGPEVAVIDKNGRVAMKHVTIDLDLGDVVEISNGLENGEHVALNISDQIADGDIVKSNLVQDETSPAPSPMPSHSVTMAGSNPDTARAH